MKIGQVTQLTSYSLAPGTSESLAALLPEMHTLAGWQALDMGNVTESWSHYGHSKAAAARTAPLHTNRTPQRSKRSCCWMRVRRPTPLPYWPPPDGTPSDPHGGSFGLIGGRSR